MIQAAPPPAIVQAAPAPPPARADNASEDPASHAGASSAAAPGKPPAPVTGAPTTGIESYPASFFAAAQPVTANDMIARLPGFAYDDGGSVRGFGGAAGNVLIDGKRPASKTDSLSNILARIPARLVLRIDIIRGGAPGIDMQGKAVIANVVRRAGASSTFAVALTQQIVASDGRYVPLVRIEGAHTGADGKSWSGSLIGGRELDDSVGDGYRRALDGSGRVLGEARDTARGDGGFFTASGSYTRPALGGTLRLTASGGFEGFVSTERVGTIAGVSDASDERDDQGGWNGEVGANLTRALGRRLTSETVLLQQVTTQDYHAAITAGSPADIQLFRQSHVQTETIARETLTWTPSAKLTVQGGGEGDYNRLSSDTAFSDNGVPQSVPAADVTVDEWRGEAFAKAILTMSKRLSLEIGAREEVSRIGSIGDVVLAKTLSFFKPRALVTWTVHGEDQIRVRLEREVDQLNFDDFVASSSFSTGQVRAGNPDLVPQTSDVVEAAFEKHFAKTGAAVVTLRHAWLHDVLDRAPIFSDDGTVFDAPANIGSGTRDDVIGTLTLPLAPLGLKNSLIKADAAWRRSSVTDPTTGEARPISGLYPFDGTVTLSEDLPRRHLTVSATVRTGRQRTYYYFNQIEANRQFPSAQLQAIWHPKRAWTVQFSAYDIAQARKRRVTYWANTRASGPPASGQERRLSIGPILQLRLRRDW